jgi:hypothetical protein
VCTTKLVKILTYKRKKKFFLEVLFCIFLENSFLGIKNQFSPFFSAISSPIGLKIFLVRLQVIWVGRFFFLDTFYQSSLAGFAKFLGSKKSRDFAKCSVFWFSSLKYLEFLKKKKNGHPDWVRLPTVKISAQTDEICGFAGGGKLFASLSPWDLWKSMKMTSGKFVSMTTFALLLEVYLP